MRVGRAAFAQAGWSRGPARRLSTMRFGPLWRDPEGAKTFFRGWGELEGRRRDIGFRWRWPTHLPKVESVR